MLKQVARPGSLPLVIASQHHAIIARLRSELAEVGEYAKQLHKFIESMYRKPEEINGVYAERLILTLRIWKAEDKLARSKEKEKP